MQIILASAFLYGLLRPLDAILRKMHFRLAKLALSLFGMEVV